jgi:hypothetical protein
LEQLELEEKSLQAEVEELEWLESRRMNTRTTADHIRRFIEEFEEVFEAAPVAEKKFLLRKWISQIEIDKVRGVAKISVRRIPAVTEELEQLYRRPKPAAVGVVGQQKFGVDAKPQKNTPTTAVVGVACSGDPNFARPTTLHRLVEVEIR